MNFGWIVTIFTGLIGLAMVAIIVSQKAQTSSILQALGTSGSQLLGAATAPVSGNQNGM